MPPSRFGVTWAVQEHVLDGLYRLAAWASELFLGVEGVEPLGVFPVLKAVERRR